MVEISQSTIDCVAALARSDRNDYNFPRRGDAPAVLFYQALSQLLPNLSAGLTVSLTDDHPLGSWPKDKATEIRNGFDTVAYYRPCGNKIQVALSRDAARWLKDSILLSVLENHERPY